MAVLLATVLVLAVTASPTLAAPGKNGRGAESAKPRAAFGISTAIANSGGGGCGLGCELSRLR